MNLSTVWSLGISKLWELIDRSRYLFYMVNPYEAMFPDLNVPRYITQLYPALIFVIFLENLVLYFRGKPILRVNESIASLSSGILQDCFRLYLRSFELVCYVLVFEHYRITTLPWDSIYTWLLCFVLLDWGFYWAHRLAHEINLIWLVHQAHHSGESFGCLTAFRQALLQPFTAWITYLPLAVLGIPPQIFLTHLQLTELYMIWLHTEAVQTLGPLEWILNCPSHHRVHHGRNRKYIDKNYGGVLLIWDLLFGTYEAEDPDEPVVSGLVHPVESFNIFYLQFHSWISMFKNIYRTEGWRNKLSIPFMGPGWRPGTPRLGYIDEIPLLQHPVTYWDPQNNLFQKLYVIGHFAIVLIFHHELSVRSEELSSWTLLISIGFVLTSLTSFGFIFENKKFAVLFEMSRCLVFFCLEQWLIPFRELSNVDGSYRLHTLIAVRSIFLASSIACAICELHRMSGKLIDYVKCDLKHKLL